MAKTTALVFFLLMILSTSETFDFTLEHSISVPSNTRQLCGILQCHATLASADQSNSFRQIRSLTVYKKVTTGNTGRWEKLASITSDHTSESKMSNGARIFGEIISHHAHLTLDLVDPHDCQFGQLSCMVFMEDSQGRIWSRTH
ncbi:hypothetical protein PoB_007321500 [Plakobranchus ocellatus]|uniref:Uncharacterized protein n=1 Tax=Plakobranchus ocellatus TaxID=259542 RepID=A0AAV4DRN4_9GAST|nr:hypothetical protein PoB_007321500 [Plakobranchus ocellatus]